MSQLSLYARQELRLVVRSRWTQIFALVFAFLALAVASSGYILSGGSGVQDFARTGASLLQLVLLLVPITALVDGVLAIAPERGLSEILYSQPVARGRILLGRLLGRLVALAAAQAIGFGAAGVVIFSHAGGFGLPSFLVLFGAAIALTAVFLSIAAALAAGGTGRRVRALGLALAFWFGAVVLFDVAALGAASLLPSMLASRLLIVATLANPVDAARTGVLLGLEGTGAFGPASAALMRFTGGPAGAAAAIAASLVAWTVLPLLVARFRLSRADL